MFTTNDTLTIARRISRRHPDAFENHGHAMRVALVVLLARDAALDYPRVQYAACKACGRVRKVWNDDAYRELPSGATFHTNPLCQECSERAFGGPVRMYAGQERGE